MIIIFIVIIIIIGDFLVVSEVCSEQRDHGGLRTLHCIQITMQSQKGNEEEEDEDHCDDDNSDEEGDDNFDGDGDSVLHGQSNNGKGHRR